MPVIVAEAAPQRRRVRPGVLLALLLGPPLLAVALFVSASIRPLELGPFIVIATVRTFHIRDIPWFDFVVVRSRRCTFPLTSRWSRAGFSSRRPSKIPL